MIGFERAFVLWSLAYMACYVPLSIFVAASGMMDRLWPVVLPLHLLGMAQNLVAVVLTIRDLYKRPFPRPNEKLTWGLLIVCTGGVGWVAYVFKHALKTRDPGSAGPAAAADRPTR